MRVLKSGSGGSGNARLSGEKPNALTVPLSGFPDGRLAVFD